MKPYRQGRGPCASRARGFSFIEILVVMGIIAVLAGMVVVAIMVVAKKGPQDRTKLLLNNLTGTIGHWKSTFSAYPPGDMTRLVTVTGMTQLKIPKLPNTNNLGIESLYQALYLPGFNVAPTLREPDPDNESAGDVGNSDDDRLDKPFNSKDNAELWEIRDAWQNPYIYFSASDYAAADRTPPVYLCGNAQAPSEVVQPKPWRSATGGFVNPNSYQLFSMGPDMTPNTDDDIKAWE